MKNGKKKGMALALMAGLVLSLAACGGKPGAGQPQNSGGIAAAATGDYDITGTWYSDREGGDTLTLTQSGEYTSSDWLVSGKYSVDADVITLTDPFADSHTLTVAEQDGAYVLRYSGAAAHTYHRTVQNAEKAREQQMAGEEEVQRYWEDALLPLLTTGEWVNAAENVTKTTVVFTENSITVSYGGDEYTETQTDVYSYVILSAEYTVISAEESTGYYNITLDLHNETSGLDRDNSTMSIRAYENNTYLLTCRISVPVTKTLPPDALPSNTAGTSATEAPA